MSDYLPDTACNAFATIVAFIEANISHGAVDQWSRDCQTVGITRLESLRRVGQPSLGVYQPAQADGIVQKFLLSLAEGKIYGFVLDENGDHKPKDPKWWYSVEEIDFDRSQARIGDQWFSGALFCSREDFERWQAGLATAANFTLKERVLNKLANQPAGWDDVRGNKTKLAKEIAAEMGDPALWRSVAATMRAYRK